MSDKAELAAAAWLMKAGYTLSTEGPDQVKMARRSPEAPLQGGSWQELKHNARATVSADLCRQLLQAYDVLREVEACVRKGELEDCLGDQVEADAVCEFKEVYRRKVEVHLDVWAPVLEVKVLEDLPLSGKESYPDLPVEYREFRSMIRIPIRYVEERGEYSECEGTSYLDR